MTDGPLKPTLGLTSEPREHFSVIGDRLIHEVPIGTGVRSSIKAVAGSASDPKGAWWRRYLEQGAPSRGTRGPAVLRTIDLFCGPGGLANGVEQLCAELEIGVTTELVVDQDEEATAIYTANHAARRRRTESVSQLIDFGLRETTAGTEFSFPPEFIDSEMAGLVGAVDMVLAGPPCQGHSNLNNHTRREDPRNGLYLTVPAIAVAVQAPTCIVENVPAVLNDFAGVVRKAQQLFEGAGYEVTTGMLAADAMGWPQRRTRHFMIARRGLSPIPLQVVRGMLSDTRARSIWWAIGDLEDASTDLLIDQQTELSDENRDRVGWLFDNDEHDLALPERPKSHRNGTSYTAVYGRLKKDEPSPTITTGFMSPGRGRYVHPTRRRVLTAHEAARLQGFPDTYEWVPDPVNPPSRSKLAKWIGDAVPMPLGYAAALSALGAGLPNG